MNVIGDVEGRTCILQDDIIDTAGTIQKAATALKAAGAARVLACAVHPVLSGPAIDRIQSAPIDQLIVTNTIPLRGEAQQCRKIVVLSVARLLGQAIRSIHEETSVSSLVCVKNSTQKLELGLEIRIDRKTSWKLPRRDKRESRGKNEARRLRVAGRIPAVVYGADAKAAERKARAEASARCRWTRRPCCGSCTRTRARTR